MRSLILCFVAMLVAGCESDRMTAQVSRVEVQAPGLTVTLDAKGSDEPVANIAAEGQKPKSFEVSPVAYARFLKRVEMFKSASGPTDETSKRFLSETCPADTPYVTDAGMISIRWIGVGLDRIYVADLGCDPRKNAARNRRLRAVVNGLPIPRDPNAV